MSPPRGPPRGFCQSTAPHNVTAFRAARCAQTGHNPLRAPARPAPLAAGDMTAKSFHGMMHAVILRRRHTKPSLWARRGTRCRGMNTPSLAIFHARDGHKRHAELLSTNRRWSSLFSSAVFTVVAFFFFCWIPSAAAVFIPDNSAEFRQAIQSAFQLYTNPYGSLETWDISKVTSTAYSE